VGVIGYVLLRYLVTTLMVQFFSGSIPKRPMDQIGPREWQQAAQLPLRNRASAMHFFVAKLLFIAVTTYSYIPLHSPPNRKPVQLT